MKRSFLILAALLFILITSCKKKDVQPNPVTLFHDDFNNNNNNWFTKNDTNVYAAINGGYYFFENKNANGSYRSWNNVAVIDQSKNFSIKASVNYVLGDPSYGLGIIWGDKDSSYYEFLISVNGAFIIIQSQNGQPNILKNWTASSMIKRGTAPNLLEIRKEDNTDEFYINQVQVFSMPHQSFYGNAIGFKVDNYLEMAVDYIDVSQW